MKVTIKEILGFYFPAIVLLGCLFFSSCSQKGIGESVSEPSTYAFTNVNVIPMEKEMVFREQTVIVRGGLILDLGPSKMINILSEAEIIDGSGRYLMPGLTDFHIHLRSTDELISYLAYGVTSVVNMSGAPDLLRYREQIEKGELVGPRLFTTGPILDGDPPIFSGVSTSISSPVEAKLAVQNQKREGYDFIKVYNNLTPDLLLAITEAADSNGMAVLGHIPRKSGRKNALQNSLESGQDLIAHSEEYFFTYFYSGVESLLNEDKIPFPDESRIPDAVMMTKEANTAVIPNLSFVAATRKQLDDINNIWNDPETRFLYPEVLEMWEEQNFTNRPDLKRFDKREQAKYPFLQKLTKEMNTAGILLLLGTDASAPGLFPGKSAHLELKALVKAGLSPYEALLTGTANPYKFIGRYKPGIIPFGKISKGYRADMVLLGKNPLENIDNSKDIWGVMTNGKYYKSSELEAIREEVAKSYLNERTF